MDDNLQSAFTPDALPPLPLAGSGARARYLARQPILGRDQSLHGYELLFRSGPESIFPDVDLDAASRQTLDLSLLFGTASFTGRHLAYVNCTRNTLLSDTLSVLPRERVVLEILEDVPADRQTLEACERLHRAGYRIALDDYVPTFDTMRLLRFADIVKVDFLATDEAAQAAIAADMRRRGVRLLAEKVETREQFQSARELGYHYFQGYFFHRPENLSLCDIPSSKLAYIRVLSLAHREVLDMDRLEQAIAREPSLCYRLLRYLNSPAFGLFRIRSIRHAMLLLGEREIRRWVSIMVAVSLAGDSSEELIYCALVRARCCELLAGLFHADAGQAFFTGILSLMDAILNRPMHSVIAQLPLTGDCKSALMGGTNPLARLLRMATASERGEWDAVSASACKSGVAESAILDAHWEASRWACEILMENRNSASPAKSI